MRQGNKNLRLAQVHEIHKDCFLCTLTKYLWRPHNRPTPITSQLRVILPKNVKHPTKKLQEMHMKNEKYILYIYKVIEQSLWRELWYNDIICTPPHNGSHDRSVPMDMMPLIQFRLLLH